MGGSAHAGTKRKVYFGVGRFSADIGGPFRTLQGYAEALAGRGHEVHVYAMHPVGQTAGSALEPGVADASVEFIEGRAPVLSLLKVGWQLRRETLVVFGLWHLVFFAFAVPRLLPGRGRGRFVLVPTNSLSAWDWNKHRRLKQALRPVVGVLLRRCDRVIFSTRGEMNASQPQVAAARRQVIYHPMHPVAVSQEPRADLLSVLFCARITRQKDLPLFLRAVSFLPETWTGHIVGDGDPEEVAAAASLADELGIAHRVRWHGWLEAKELTDVMLNASVLLVTSHEENFCHSAVEAMALRVPVVVVNRVAIATDVGDLGIGLVVEADPETVARAAIELHESGSLREALTDAGFRFAHERANRTDWPAIAEAVAG